MCMHGGSCNNDNTSKTNSELPVMSYEMIEDARRKIQDEFGEMPVEFRMRPDFFEKFMKEGVTSWGRPYIQSSPNTVINVIGMKITVDRTLKEEWRMFTQKELDIIKDAEYKLYETEYKLSQVHQSLEAHKKLI